MNYWCSLAFLRLFYVMMLTWSASSFAEGSKLLGRMFHINCSFSQLRGLLFSTFRALWTDSVPTGVRGKILYLQRLQDLIFLKESWKMQLSRIFQNSRNISAFKKTGTTHAARSPVILGLEHPFSWQCCWASMRWIPISSRGPCKAVEEAPALSHCCLPPDLNPSSAFC